MCFLLLPWFSFGVNQTPRELLWWLSACRADKDRCTALPVRTPNLCQYFFVWLSLRWKCTSLSLSTSPVHRWPHTLISLGCNDCLSPVSVCQCVVTQSGRVQDPSLLLISDSFSDNSSFIFLEPDHIPNLLKVSLHCVILLVYSCCSCWTGRTVFLEAAVILSTSWHRGLFSGLSCQGAAGFKVIKESELSWMLIIICLNRSACRLDVALSFSSSCFFLVVYICTRPSNREAERRGRLDRLSRRGERGSCRTW